MSCETCIKICRKTIATCAWCSGNSKDKCTSTEVRCYHCGGDHQTFSRNCPIFKIETEIVQTQTKERIPRLHSIHKLLRLTPNPELFFSNAVKNPSNRTTSKSPSRWNKKVNRNLVRTTHSLYCPTATDTILREKVKRKGARPPHL